MKSGDLKKRLEYWFDQKMAKGTSSMVQLLAVISVVVVLFVSVFILIFKLCTEKDLFSVIWDILASTVNAEFPSAEDGVKGYVILTALSAIAGLFITSSLIGIISSAIEDKISSLRKGNSIVLERDHIVVLGFSKGQYMLISQLLAAEGGKACIVIADETERGEMEQEIYENIELGKKEKIVCRKADITSPASLEICSIPTCKSIVINGKDDLYTTKVVLAVTKLLEKYNKTVPIVTRIDHRRNIMPDSFCARHKLYMIRTRELIARIISRCCVQTGLSRAFNEIFSFEGSEFYLKKFENAGGKPFSDIVNNMHGGVPVGIYREEKYILNPEPQTLVEKDDQLLYFAETKESAYLFDDERNTVRRERFSPAARNQLDDHKIAIIGSNRSLPSIIDNLPGDTSEVRLVKVSAADEEAFLNIARESKQLVTLCEKSALDMGALPSIMEEIDHVIILSDYEQEEESADLQNIQLLLRLRQLREEEQSRFTITIELRKESNQHLVDENDPTDFVISSNITSLVLAQLAEDHRLYRVFRDITARSGNEFMLLPARAFCKIDDVIGIKELRNKVLAKGFILMGYQLGEYGDNRFILNPAMEDEVYLSDSDCLIVFGKSRFDEEETA